MKKINLKNYVGKGFNPNTNRVIDAPYDVKESLVAFLFGRNLNLNPVQLLKQNKLANKILDAKDSVILETEEYDRLKKALEVGEGLGRNEVELCQRVLEAEEVKVKVVETKKK